MASNPSTPYFPSESNAPSSTLPEHMHGLIELATLADMNRFLKESKSADDLTLAGWIQDTFLYDPMDQTTRPIRTPEGFAKLDNAYRRVRSLTNKVQDKWPFLDQNYRAMSTATVRNNSRGEASPGIMFKPERGVLPANDATATATSSTPELQAPSDTYQLGRSRVHGKEPARSEHAPAPLPQKPLTPPKLSQEKDSQTTNITTSQSGELTPADSTVFDGFPERTDEFPALDENLLGESLAGAEEQSDCHRGQGLSHMHDVSINSDLMLLYISNPKQLRGTDGRFQPKALSSIASKKTTQRRVAKASNHLDSRKPGSEMPQTAHSEPANTLDSVSDVPQPSTPFAASLIETTEVTDLPVPDPNVTSQEEEAVRPAIGSSKPRVRFSDITSEDSTPTYALAVESDPILSNLDKLPPNSFKRTTKRKSPPSSQSSPKPIKRGRPSDVKKTPVAADVTSHNGVDAAPAATPTVQPEKIGVTTRRSARRSAATDMEVAAPPQPSVTNYDTAEKTKSSEQTGTLKDVETSNNIQTLKETEALVSHDDDDTMFVVDARPPTTLKEKAEPTPPFKVKKTRAKAVPRVTSPRATRSKTTVAGLEVSPQSTSASADHSLIDLAMDRLIQADAATSQPGPTPAKRKKSQSKSGAPPPISALEASANAATGMPIPSSAASDSMSNWSTLPEEPEIQFYALIFFPSGRTVNIPISTNRMKPEEEQLLVKYAAFIGKKGAARIDLETYREIYFDAKKE
ncbi:hypothetical protein NX059_001426 [Plenodomus lindquistii]|nr:hypothetical protein NX059_001426 [Plenodomus lindquistii]